MNNDENKNYETNNEEKIIENNTSNTTEDNRYETNEMGYDIPNNEGTNNIIQENKNYENNKEIGKDIQSNEDVIKAKVENIVNDLNEINQKEDKRKRKKTIIFTIAIILEALIIAYILYNKKSNNEDNLILRCTNNESELNTNYSMKMTNIYYFNKDREVVKTSNEILYAYNDQDSYNKFISTLNETETNFKGYTKQSAKDDKNYIYKTVTTYTYSELKKNKEVKYKDKVFTFKLPNSQEETSILVQNYDDVVDTNNMMNFTCE